MNRTEIRHLPIPEKSSPFRAIEIEVKGDFTERRKPGVTKDDNSYQTLQFLNDFFYI